MTAIILVVLGCFYGLIVLVADLWLRRDYNDMLELKCRVDDSLDKLITLIGPEAALDIINGNARIELFEKENDDETDVH